MNYLFLLFSTFIVGSLHAQLNRFEQIEWRVNPIQGLSNSIIVDMELTTWNGKKIFVEHGKDLLRWDAFTFKSSKPIAFKAGIGFYHQMTDFSGVDSIKVEVTCTNSKLNSVFYVPVKYCTALDLEDTKVPYDEYFSLNWQMIMNTGEHFPYHSAWANIDELVNESESHFTIENQTLKTRSKEPFPNGVLRLVHPKTQRVVFERTMQVQVSSELRIDFSGRAGRNGRKGQNGTIASQSGSNGELGENGSFASAVTLFVRPTVVNEIPLFEVFIIADSKRKHLFVNTLNTKLIVDVSGGNGGHGGDGGTGADAIQTDKSYDRLHGGAGGSGGYGGNGGDGGDVLIYIEDSTAVDESAFSINTSGGNGGKSGNPGVGGVNDRGNDGIIARALIRNERIEGSNGLGGEAGRDGEFLGFRYLDSQSFNEQLSEAGWR